MDHRIGGRDVKTILAVLTIIAILSGGVMAVDKRIRDQVDDRLRPVQADIQVIRADVRTIRAHLMGGN